MNNVNKHIRSLLFTHDCVIVPGLGGLVANPIPAQYDRDKNLFTPPSKEIVFNKDLRHNDGLLVEHISRNENISYEEAYDQIKDFVREISEGLKKKESISLANAGELTMDKDNNLVFTFNNTENFLTDSYGLTSLHFNPVYGQSRTLSTKRNTKKVSLHTNTKQIAAGIALIAGLFFFTPEIKNPVVNKAGGIDFLIPAEKTIEAPGKTDLANSNSAKEENKTYKVTPEKIKTEKKNYFIIAGSFKEMKQAKQFCNDLKSKTDTNPLIIKSRNGRFRVAVEGFNSKDKALSSLKTLRKTKEFESAWLLAQK